MGKNGCREGVSLFRGVRGRLFLGSEPQNLVPGRPHLQQVMKFLPLPAARVGQRDFLSDVQQQEAGRTSPARGRNAGWVLGAATATSVTSTASPGQGFASGIKPGVCGLSLALLPVCRHSLS